MTSTAILTEDSATIVAEEASRFSWSVAIAGAAAAMATSFLLITLGAGVGLALAPAPNSSNTATFLTLGAIYFFAAQAFGFAVGGYLVGRLMGPQAETGREEEFRAAAHGLVMWAIVVVAGLLVVGAASSLTAASAAAASRGQPAASSYWLDVMFRPAPNSPQVAADKAEAGRILTTDVLHPNAADNDRLARLVSQDAGLSPPAAMTRVADAEAGLRQAADTARRAASIVSLWTAFALIFGAIVAVATSITARWMDDRITFGFAPRP